MRGDRRGWYKVSDLRPGVEIAVPSEKGQAIWDEIVSITPVGREQVYDIEVEGTHNFVGNCIFAHNTYVLRANTMLAVTGEVNAGSFTVPIGNVADATSTPALGSEIPSVVLTADGLGVDLYKLATYNLAATHMLAARLDETDVRVASLESRVEALESGAISSESTSLLSLSTTSLASALESFGVLIRNGIAQFNTLVFRQLVASKDADGTSSAGSVSILTGNTVAQVNNSLVLPTTKVFVTFNSQIAGSWWVSDKAVGSFRVVLSAPQATDVSFDYFLVQTEGQLATSTPSAISNSQFSISNQLSSSNDTQAPVITLIGDNPVRLAVGDAYAEPGVTITDNVDASVSYTTFVDGIEQPADAGTVDTSSETTHIITYRAMDVAGNTTTAQRAVIVGNPDGAASGASGGTASSTPATSSDTAAPVVTLTGAAALELNVGDAFTDPGATATDEVDGDLTVHIIVTGLVDTATAGSYTLTYSATDAAGNEGSVSRLVAVVAQP